LDAWYISVGYHCDVYYYNEMCNCNL